MFQLDGISKVTKSTPSDFDIERIYLFGSYARNETADFHRPRSFGVLATLFLSRMLKSTINAI